MEKMEWNPKRILETSGGYWAGCTLHAAVKLDIFSALADREMTASVLAKKVKCNSRSLEMILNAATAMNLLEKKGEKFRNSDASRNFLAKDSPRYIGNIICHHNHLVESWSKLDKAVKTGKPVRTRASWDDKKIRESFLMGMFNIASNLAPEIVKKVDLSGRGNFLDLGGGPGTYAIHFCLSNPKLRGTVYDLPTTKPFAQKTVKRFKLEKRIDFQPGDFTKNPIKGSYDVAWLSHILHGENPTSCQKVVKKAVTALNPGGMIMIHEFILNNTMDGPLFPALFSLNMLLGTHGGQAYSENQLIDMLKKEGIKKIRRLDFRGPNDSGIIAGIK